MKHLLLMGATGYLGQHLLMQLLEQGYKVSLLLRSAQKLPQSIKEHPGCLQIFERDLQHAVSYEGVCETVDAVITTLGITRQKDGLSYMDVDYGMNKMLLDEALRAGVESFLYVSVLHGEHLRHLKICEAKERFVDLLLASRIHAIVVRPSGFFSDMLEFLQMAKSGRAYLFHDGSYKANPIDGADLATFCIDALSKPGGTYEVGGPDVLSHTQIAELAFKHANKVAKINYIPLWVLRVVGRVMQFVLPQKQFGPIEFFMQVMTMDMVAPQHGKRDLQTFYMSHAGVH